MLICHAIIAVTTLLMFFGTLRIKVRKEISLPTPSASGGASSCSNEFDLWN